MADVPGLEQQLKLMQEDEGIQQTISRINIKMFNIANGLICLDPFPSYS